MNPHRSALVLILGTGLALALLSGCTTTAPTIRSHPDTAVNFTHYQSFILLKPLTAPARNPAITPSLVRDLREEAARAFSGKGLKKSPDSSADALILIHGGLQDKLEVTELGLGYGRFGRGLGHQDLDTYKEGSLYVDVFDARTRELIWRGSAVAEVSGMPETTQLKETVRTIISRYPN
ncbi:MAG: DUF4136 domain-containing protein [Opitutaceae bacterium]